MTTHEVSGYQGSTRLALRIKRWLVAAFGLGFFGVAVDVFLEHYLMLHSPAQWMPIIFGPLAGVVDLGTAWRFEARTLRFFLIVSSMSIAIGGLGLYYHGVAVWHRLGSPHDLVDWPKLLPGLRYVPPLGAHWVF